MRKLLSLPPNLVDYFHEIEQRDKKEWFCTSDPLDKKLGSGGGTVWLLDRCWKSDPSGDDFDSWLKKDKKILLHAGGQSRRLPAYAPSGKILTPIPVFRWARGQKLSQNLLDLQLPLYEDIMRNAPDTLHTLVASGDIYVHLVNKLPHIPDADVVCLGLWTEPSIARNHGVFISEHSTPDTLGYMLQKPSPEKLSELIQTHYFLMDIGIWLLSDKAVRLLMKRSHNSKNELDFYDLYGTFGLALGKSPSIHDREVNELNVAILPLECGEFYHYGTSPELISSTLKIQNRVYDQRAIIHKKVKPHPAMFVQNSILNYSLTSENYEVWIENSCIGEKWKLNNRHIITGIPENNWELELPVGVCLDIVPVKEKGFVVRPYGIDDIFTGNPKKLSTLFMGQPFVEWLSIRGLDINDISGITDDIQTTSVFPLCDNVEDIECVLRWMLSEPALESGKKIWLGAKRFSAEQISAQANLRRLYRQRKQFRLKDWQLLGDNYEKSVFYQLDLKDAAKEYAQESIPLPAELPPSVSTLNRIHDQMFRAMVMKLRGKPFHNEENRAFGLLKEYILETIRNKKQNPAIQIAEDQIVWGRSPIRIDLAGGWSDTPPYCILSGGNVVNMAVELNGQPPLQVYVKSGKKHSIILRSIDLGVMEEITTYEELQQYECIGSPFSIPKAALALAGFLPRFSAKAYKSLEEQLASCGGGMEITLFSAIPAGSGLGTSSILAATVLGALSDFCSLGWEKNEICERTLVLEQLLTTGGGWQDQYGGVLQGIKLLQTVSGYEQSPQVRWLPEFLFTHPEYKQCHLLYYTGITRYAKDILGEIVRGMFLNSSGQLHVLAEIKNHALDLYEAIQKGNFKETGTLIRRSWEQNKLLDAGTNPFEVEMIINRIKDLALGYKLTGAGGGGFLYIIAKDPEAAGNIRNILTADPVNPRARFVDMALSDKGLTVSRS